jgi:signal transduction histidine kinase
MGLIEDLLSFARIEAGHETIQVQPLLLSDVVEQAVSIVTPLAQNKGLAIRAELPPEPVTLFTDARKLRQILINLLANSVKFSTDGEVFLEIRVAAPDVDARVRFQFEVTDQGIGMTKQEQAHAFDAFWQARTAKTSQSGSGLGLSVARKLAHLLGGDLTISASEPGRGSTFLMTLPASCAEPAPSGQPAVFD